MSSALYNTRLYWDGRHGIAKHDGVAIELKAWPADVLPGTAVMSIDYTPEVRRGELVTPGDTYPRQMTPEQKRLAFAWLQSIAAEARAKVEP